MIIREYNTEFYMIEQHHHAQISANIIKNWQDSLFSRDLMAGSVLYAIQNHDCGWRYFDNQPFWNDVTQSPYTFIDFPVLPKVVLYTEGINEVEAVNPYAASLCSAHYTAFMKKSTSKEAVQFVEQEKKRLNKIKSVMGSEQFKNFQKHLGILQFADNLSLYICLNEAGVEKAQEHYFFQEGIPIARNIGLTENRKVNIYWQDKQTVVLGDIPAVPSFTVTLQQKKIMKKTIEKEGIIKAYTNTPYEKKEIRFQVHA